MSKEFKPGDRVKVEFVGEVAAMGGWFAYIKTDVGEISVEPDWCTLIEPEIVLPEIPGTIVQVDPHNEHTARISYECVYLNDGAGAWYGSGFSGRISTMLLVERCRQFGYRVIPAAEAVTE